MRRSRRLRHIDLLGVEDARRRIRCRRACRERIHLELKVDDRLMKLVHLGVNLRPLDAHIMERREVVIECALDRRVLSL
jgi:hypothetical protein